MDILLSSLSPATSAREMRPSAGGPVGIYKQVVSLLAMTPRIKEGPLFDSSVASETSSRSQNPR